MKILLLKPAHSVCEECCCGRTANRVLPAQIVLAAQYLINRGWDAAVCDLQVQQLPDLSAFDAVAVWLSLLETFYDEIGLVRAAKDAGATTIAIVNDPYGLELRIMEEHPCIDVLVRLYEREMALENVISRLADGGVSGDPLAGAIMRAGGILVDGGEKPVLGADCSFLSESTGVMATLPIAAYDKYFVLTGKGCPYGCAFCQYRATKPRKRRHRDILREIEFLVDRGVRHIGLLDLNFTIDPAWAFPLLDAIAARRYPTVFTLDCRLEDALNTETLDRFSRARVAETLIGIETFSEASLACVKKPIPVARIGEAMRNCAKRRIIPNLSFMIGFPDDTPRDLEAIASFVKKGRYKTYHIAYVIPALDSPLYRTYKERGLMIGDSLKDYVGATRRPLVRSRELGAPELVEFKERTEAWANGFWNLMRYIWYKKFRVNPLFAIRRIFSRGYSFFSERF
jgi:hypothetical protein